MKDSKVIRMFLILLVTQQSIFAVNAYLLPVDANELGWNYNSDLGWSYIGQITDTGIWFWIPIFPNFESGRWMYSSKALYPNYWNNYVQVWDNINWREISNPGMYSYVHDQDYLTGNSFQSIEAYVPSEGIVNMRPRVTFLENHELRYFYSDFGGRGIWTYVDGIVLTDSSFIGDRLSYNPHSQILIMDGQKYRKLEADGV